MSIEQYPDDDREPSKFDNIERYASDLCTVTNYVSVRSAAEDFLINEFNFNEANARSLLDVHEANGAFPTSKAFEEDQDTAMDLARMHLYSFMLGRHEMEALLQSCEATTKPDMDSYREWVQWVLMAVEGGDAATHKVDECLSTGSTLGMSCTRSSLCPFKFVLNSVDGETYRYDLEIDEIDLADAVSARSGGYIDNEYARLNVMISALKVYGWIDESQHKLHEQSLKSIRRSMYYVPDSN